MFLKLTKNKKKMSRRVRLRVIEMARIFFKLRFQRTQVHSSPAEQKNQTISINTLRYRQTVSTSLWLQIAVMFCFFFPYMLLAPFAYHQIEEKHSTTLYIQFYSTVTLLFSKSA